MAALREAKERGTGVLAITNVVDSTATREAYDVIFTWAGPQSPVASTKAYTTQMVSLYLFAVWLAQERCAVGAAQVPTILLEHARTAVPRGDSAADCTSRESLR